MHPLTTSEENLAIGWLKAMPVMIVNMKVNKKLTFRKAFVDIGFMVWIFVGCAVYSFSLLI